MIGGQLQDLAESGVLECSQMVIAVAVPQQHANLNAYEYPAIHSLYRMAMSEPDEAARNHLFLYFHTKGMVNHGKFKTRVDRRLFYATIVPWRAIAQQFIENSSIRAAGWLPSTDGFVWFNFWRVRRNYVKQLDEPKRVTERHWFESWIGKGPEEVRNATKVLSTCTCDFRSVAINNVRKAASKCKTVTPSTCMP